MVLLWVLNGLYEAKKRVKMDHWCVFVVKHVLSGIKINNCLEVMWKMCEIF